MRNTLLDGNGMVPQCIQIRSVLFFTCIKQDFHVLGWRFPISLFFYFFIFIFHPLSSPFQPLMIRVQAALYRERKEEPTSLKWKPYFTPSFLPLPISTLDSWPRTPLSFLKSSKIGGRIEIFDNLYLESNSVAIWSVFEVPFGIEPLDSFCNLQFEFMSGKSSYSTIASCIWFD